MRSKIRLAAAAAVLILIPFTWTAPASAGSDDATVTISGRGWGHGRGLGQYGAYGYATEKGWSSARILDHFYVGTTAGTVPAGNPVDPDRLRVDLSYNKGNATTVGLTTGRILMRGPGYEDLGHISNGAVRVAWDGSRYLVSYASSCAGPWTVLGAIDGHASVRLVADTSADVQHPDGMLHVCRAGGSRTWYSGEIIATQHQNVRRTVNLTTIEEYLRGVVPNESPAHWPAAALEAQAVAARSYAMAGDSRQLPWADTCETTRCQVFKGRFHQTGAGRVVPTTDTRTDAAIAATTGEVRINGAGRVARTEFSSSTGGHTAGGTFPAVVDEGDGTSANPNREWNTVVNVDQLEAKFGRGRLLELVVTKRNGLGVDGGRVLEIEFRFERGTVVQNGWTARTTLGLKSDWFTVGPIVRGETEQIGNYVDALGETFLGASPDPATRESWTARVYRDQTRTGLVADLAQSDTFAGVMLADLYTKAFGRSPDPAGEAYWRGVLRSGYRIDRIGANFLASEEYFLAAGGTDEGFLRRLYRDILGRDADGDGLTYWLDKLDTGTERFTVAASFYRSIESREDRATIMYERIIGFTPSAPSLNYWSNRLLSTDDLGIAVELAASDRFFTQAQ